jgi:hypothetical protein
MTEDPRNGAAFAVLDWHKLAVLLLLKERTATKTKDSVPMVKILIGMADAKSKRFGARDT